MASRRTAKIAEAVRHVVSNAILFGLRDPRVKNVTVLNVEVAGDLRTAKVYISILGDEKSQRLSLQGLNSARGWIQSKIASELDLRLTPVLTFVLDPGVKKSIEVARLLRELNPPEDDMVEESEEIMEDGGVEGE
ncbi:MAG: 30S ribosome-binding factor RbfA [Planctomycetaceae bacterium]|nr:30S ribosome-binding factor RbfA [Planctomycetaceae bacterium]